MNFMMYVVLVLFSIFTGLRSLNFNLDSINYTYYFEQVYGAIKEGNLNVVFYVFEPFFTLYTGLCTLLFTVEYIQLYFVFSSFIPTLILLHLFWKKRFDPILFCVFFVTIFYTYNTTFIRQYIAISLFFYFAIIMSLEKKFVLRYLITPFWHFSSFITLPFMFIRYMKLRNLIYCFIIILFIFTFLSFLNPLFINLLIDKFTDRFNTLNDTNNVRTFFNLVLLFISLFGLKLKLRKLNLLDYLLLFTIILFYFLPTLSRLNVYITIIIITRSCFITSMRVLPARLLVVFMCIFSSFYLFINHTLMQ